MPKYTISTKVSKHIFSLACLLIENNIEITTKEKTIIKDDFPIIQLYQTPKGMINVLNDYETDEVRVESEVYLGDILDIFMEDNPMTTDAVKYIVSRLVERAYDAVEEKRENKGDAFYSGRLLAYYEVLDILKSELYVRDQDLSEYGLDVDLEKTFI